MEVGIEIYCSHNIFHPPEQKIYHILPQKGHTEEFRYPLSDLFHHFGFSFLVFVLLCSIDDNFWCWYSRKRKVELFWMQIQYLTEKKFIHWLNVVEIVLQCKATFCHSCWLWHIKHQNERERNEFAQLLCISNTIVKRFILKFIVCFASSCLLLIHSLFFVVVSLFRWKNIRFIQCNLQLRKRTSKQIYLERKSFITVTELFRNLHKKHNKFRNFLIFPSIFFCLWFIHTWKSPQWIALLQKLLIIHKNEMQ